MTKAVAGPVGLYGDVRSGRQVLAAKPASFAGKLLTALLIGCAIATTTPATADAAAGGLLTVGMKLTFGNHDCSLGFFATDSVRDQLAVTAGHCAQGLHEKVFNGFGRRIGEVVAWKPDGLDGHGKMTGSRGFTVIHLHRHFAIEPFFSSVGAAGHLQQAATDRWAQTGRERRRPPQGRPVGAMGGVEAFDDNGQ